MHMPEWIKPTIVFWFWMIAAVVVGYLLIVGIKLILPFHPSLNEPLDYWLHWPKRSLAVLAWAAVCVWFFISCIVHAADAWKGQFNINLE